MSTILFVDDHHAFRTVFAEILRNTGYMVLEAGALADAEHLLSRQPGGIDLLIVEAVLSTTNGAEIAKRFQASNPKVRVLFISERPRQDLLQEALLPDDVQFLQKPFGSEILIDKLQELEHAKTPRHAVARRAPTKVAAKKVAAKSARQRHHG